MTEHCYNCSSQTGYENQTNNLLYLYPNFKAIGQFFLTSLEDPYQRSTFHPFSKSSFSNFICSAVRDHDSDITPIPPCGIKRHIRCLNCIRNSLKNNHMILCTEENIISFGHFYWLKPWF